MQHNIQQNKDHKHLQRTTDSGVSTKDDKYSNHSDSTN